MPVKDISVRKQRIVLWWGLAFTAIYGISLWALLDMLPPPSANMSAQEVAAWYQDKDEAIRVGAMITGWTSAFMIPIWAVVCIQMYRVEMGKKVWTLLAVVSGPFMCIFLVLPPLFWGVAAFTPERSPEITQLMHQLGTLTLTTTDQIYVFAWIAVAVLALSPTTAKHSPFPRWYGYYTIWTTFMFEAGAFAFITKTGPFAWRGLLVFWSPLTLFGLWITVTSVLILKALKLQEQDPDPEPEAALATT